MQDNWRLRALRATHNEKTGEQSQLGCMLRAMLGKQGRVVPQYGRSCTITGDGYVVAPLLRRDGQTDRHSMIGTCGQVESELRKLADHCKMDDAERQELFKTFVEWVGVDERVKSILPTKLVQP